MPSCPRSPNASRRSSPASIGSWTRGLISPYPVPLRQPGGAPLGPHRDRAPDAPPQTPLPPRLERPCAGRSPTPSPGGGFAESPWTTRPPPHHPGEDRPPRTPPEGADLPAVGALTAAPRGDRLGGGGGPARKGGSRIGHAEHGRTSRRAELHQCHFSTGRGAPESVCPAQRLLPLDLFQGEMD